jgi:hypothetical protein
MKTEYRLFTRLIFWGSSLAAARLMEVLRLDAALCQAKRKGEPLKRPDGTDTGSVARTGMLIYDPAKQTPQVSHDPDSQLTAVVEALRRIQDPLAATYGVETAELQLSFYYEDKIEGEPDVVIPSELLRLFAQHGIDLRITVLP